jgi:signal transduction histidine kinase
VNASFLAPGVGKDAFTALPGVRSTGGSGLGLVIARRIITDHGGRITAESTPPWGTSITIVLPER